jgi:hypothetical protein
MDRNKPRASTSLIGLVIGLAGLFVAIVSLLAGHQARLTAAEANLIAEQARLTAEQARLTIEEAHSAAKQANDLALQANELARRNEVIRQVVIANRRLRSALSRCYQAYNDARDNQTMLMAGLEENCNVERMINTIALLSNYEFEAILALQDDLCVSSYDATATLLDRAKLEDDFTYLIALFDQSSTLSPITLDPAPDISHLLLCQGNITEDTINEVYSQLIMMGATSE